MEKTTIICDICGAEIPIKTMNILGKEIQYVTLGKLHNIPYSNNLDLQYLCGIDCCELCATKIDEKILRLKLSLYEEIDRNQPTKNRKERMKQI